MDHVTDDAVDAAPPRAEQRSSLLDFLAFRTAITPVLIRVLFVAGTLGCIAGGLWLIAVKDTVAPREPGLALAKGLAWIVLGPIALRIACEFAMLLFTMNAALQDIRATLSRPE